MKRLSKEQILLLHSQLIQQTDKLQFNEGKANGANYQL